MDIQKIKLDKIQINKDNPRTITKEKMDKLVNSILVFPKMLEIRPIVVDGNMTALGGNQRTEALKQISKMSDDYIQEKLSGISDYHRLTKEEQDSLIKFWKDWMKSKEVPVINADNLTEEEKKQFIIKDNNSFGEWDFAELQEKWDTSVLENWGVDLPIDWITNDEGNKNAKNKLEYTSLTDRYIVPPFSILDTKKGYWQKRKKEWLSLGIKSEIGRDEGITYAKSCQSPGIYEVKNYLRKEKGCDPSWDEVIEYCEKHGISTQKGTSIFDPVLCEICYRWFCTDKGKILDPFAGGSVRGIVASILGFKYDGNDLRQEQINANVENAKEILKSNFPVWTCGDSNDIDIIKNGQEYDMIFSCPPYADLEVYSDNEKDLSTMDYPRFIEVYRSIIKKKLRTIKER